MTAPPPGHDTNGFQSPQAVQPPASRYALPGWDSNKWNDPTNQDPKYVVGRILSNLPGTTDQMGTAVQRIAAAYPGTKQVGQGDIQIPGVGVIDILMKSSTGGSGWWWGDASQVAAGQKKPAPAAGAGAAGGDPYAQLMTMLMSPTPPPAYQAPTPAPQAFDISTNPQYMALQKQLADLTSQQSAWQTQQQQMQAAQQQLQQQATTWQTEAAKARGNVNNPNFAYY
jgi:hypothetical protein